MELEVAPHWLTAFLMATTRSAAWLFIVPPIGARTVPSTVKAGFAAALGLSAAPHLVDEAIPIDIAALVMAGAFQVLVGASLGFLVLLMLQAVGSAGEIIDVIGGLTVQPSLDPLSGQSASGFARHHQAIATTLVFAVGGHLLLVRGFLESFAAVGVAGLDLSSMETILVGGIGRLLLASLEIAAPLIAVMLLVELGQGLVARAAPQMNVFLAAMPLKVLLALIIVAGSLPLLPGIVSALAEGGVRDGMRILGR